MTYYEELGIDKTASPSEIQAAYRVLVRLFHPDVQTDLRVKAAADVQLRRINEIVRTLVDPRSRGKYDESLSAGALTCLLYTSSVNRRMGTPADRAFQQLKSRERLPRTEPLIALSRPSCFIFKFS